MTPKEAATLQASVDHMFSKLTILYGAVMTASIPAGEESKGIKDKIIHEWISSYEEAKASADASVV